MHPKWSRPEGPVSHVGVGAMQLWLGSEVYLGGVMGGRDIPGESFREHSSVVSRDKWG